MRIVIDTDNPQEVTNAWVKSIVLMLKSALDKIDFANEVTAVDLGHTAIKINLPDAHKFEDSIHQAEIYFEWAKLMESCIQALGDTNPVTFSDYYNRMEILSRLDLQFREKLRYEGPRLDAFDEVQISNQNQDVNYTRLVRKRPPNDIWK